jgi:hypothetical protein
MINWRQILSYRTPKEWSVGARVRLMAVFCGKPVGTEGVIVRKSQRGLWIVRFDDNEPTAYDKWGGNFIRDGYAIAQSRLELI